MIPRRLVALVLVVAACAPSPDAVRTVVLEVDGVDRQFDLLIPEGTSSGAPLVVVLHGLSGTMEEIRRVSGFDEEARRRGWVVAFPQALGFIPTWRANRAFGDADVAFLGAVIEAVAARHPVGATFVVGFSNGGGMAVRLGCDRPDLIAGIGSVAGAIEDPVCVPDRPVPLLALHGTADPIVPYDGAPGVLPPVEAWASAWAGGAGCSAAVEADSVPGTTVTVWEGCKVPVTLVGIVGGGHGWPGGRGAFSASPVSATSLLAGFIATVLDEAPVYAPRP